MNDKQLLDIIGGSKMAIDKKTIILNNGEKDINVLVYLKEVNVKNNYKNVKAFCKIINDEGLPYEAEPDEMIEEKEEVNKKN